MADDFTPRYVGDLTPLSHTFTDHSGTPFDLTGVSASGITFKLRSRSNYTVTVGAGTWTIPPATITTGVAVYTPSATDVATNGIFATEGWFDLQAGVPFPSGFQHFDMKEIQMVVPL